MLLHPESGVPTHPLLPAVPLTLSYTFKHPHDRMSAPLTMSHGQPALQKGLLPCSLGAHWKGAPSSSQGLQLPGPPCPSKGRLALLSHLMKFSPTRAVLVDCWGQSKKAPSPPQKRFRQDKAKRATKGKLWGPLWTPAPHSWWSPH